MDNDVSIKKKFVRYYKKVKFIHEYRGIKVLNELDGNRLLGLMLDSNKSFSCVRLGAVESRCISKWMRGSNYSKKDFESIHFAAGVFPYGNAEIIDRFCEEYTKSILESNIIAIWNVVGEKKILKNYSDSALLIKSKAIEPYYFDSPWSKCLEGKKVLIVHPFADSIKNQYENREKIFDNDDILPDFSDMQVLKAVQSNAGSVTQYVNWFEALNYMKNEIANIDFDVALIGAGAYGLPLASYVKKLGKKAIQMSGATQILFGIKGRRWDSHPQISKLYNEYWVRPLQEETPPSIEKVEGGSYW